MSRRDEINQAMLKEFKLHDIEDTPANRRDFLTGLRDSWVEDTESSIEKTMYLMTINLEITLQSWKDRHPATPSF